MPGVDKSTRFKINRYSNVKCWQNITCLSHLNYISKFKQNKKVKIFLIMRLIPLFVIGY